MDQLKTKLMIIGVVSTPEYQKCKFLALQLHHSFPDKFNPPQLRPMLDVAWSEYVLKIRRRIGGLTWVSDKKVAVFVHSIYVGDDDNLQEIVENCYNFRILRDFARLGAENLKPFLEKSQRPHVYFVISINSKCVGTFLFELFTDLVPDTCANFLRLCKLKKYGFTGAFVHRIAKPSWIQIGGSYMKSKNSPCENYYVPHDRRGVMSMCNDGKNNNNSTQFFVCLDPTPWMDTYYVAFGQLIHGETLLRTIESVPTKFQSPTQRIQIEEVGEYNLECAPDEKLMEIYEKHEEKLEQIRLEEKRLKDLEWQKREEELETLQICTCDDPEPEPEPEPIYPLDILDPRDVPSDLDVQRYEELLYSQK